MSTVTRDYQELKRTITNQECHIKNLEGVIERLSKENRKYKTLITEIIQRSEKAIIE